MTIRKLEKKDIDEVVELWYEASLIAHDFIPGEYWEENKQKMAEVYLPHSESYLAIVEKEITGFVSMVDDFLAAIFVDHEKQGQGIGKKLLDFVKENRTCIRLNVYKDNLRTVQFYKSQGFSVLSEVMDEMTNKAEYLMEWTKK